MVNKKGLRPLIFWNGNFDLRLYHSFIYAQRKKGLKLKKVGRGLWSVDDYPQCFSVYLNDWH